MKKLILGFGFYVSVVILVQLILVNNVYAAAPGTFDCLSTPNYRQCRVGPHACSPGTKPDETICEAVGNDSATCNSNDYKNLSCIPDPKNNTANCYLAGGGKCGASNITCQQGYKEPCSERSITNCVEAGAQCIVEKDNKSSCVWYTPNSSCRPIDSECWTGYVPNCYLHNLTNKTECEAVVDATCVPESTTLGPTIPVYDPGCTPGSTDNVKTALGCLPTDPQQFVNTALPWAIGIGAGIAFLLGVFGSVMIVLSAGNPEKMQAGKEMITSAIAGLLIIIFAIFLLTVVGVDILKLFLFEEPGHPGGGGR